ncbi:MAG: Rid family detoxifying hydrolase [Desulfurococcales archaeon]|nr:Rid family detoxifying hydrolase [Desulfurococcales archaeon]
MIELKEIVYTREAPEPVGPYSQAVVFKDLIFVSGQIPIDPKTGKVVEGDFSAKSRQALNNLVNIVRAAGGDVDTLLKVRVFLRNISKFNEFNKVYSEIIGKNPPPSRVVVEVSNLPLGVELEVEATAYKITEGKDS